MPSGSCVPAWPPAPDRPQSSPLAARLSTRSLQVTRLSCRPPGASRSAARRLSLPSHIPAATAKGFTLSIAKQVLSGKMNEVIETVEHNVRLV